MKIVAADIGGTNSRFALYDEHSHLIRKKIFPSQQYPNVETILQDFISEKVDIVTLGIAGPVIDNCCNATNLPWKIDGKLLSEQLDTKVFLLNDLKANAYGMKDLPEDQFFVVNRGKKANANMCLISAGTGLGYATILPNFECVIAGESGHNDFAPLTNNEIELLIFLQKRFGHVSYERIVSGPGLINLYDFYKEKMQLGGFKEDFDKKKLPRMMTEAFHSNCPPAVEASINTFLAVYGAFCSNMALTVLAHGGIFLGGGIAPKLKDIFSNGSFMSHFLNKGRYKELASTIPVAIIMNDQTALLGSYSYAKKKIEELGL